MIDEVLTVWIWIYAILFSALLFGLSVDYYYFHKRLKMMKKVQKEKDKADRELLRWLKDY